MVSQKYCMDVLISARNNKLFISTNCLLVLHGQMLYQMIFQVNLGPIRQPWDQPFHLPSISKCLIC